MVRKIRLGKWTVAGLSKLGGVVIRQEVTLEGKPEEQFVILDKEQFDKIVKMRKKLFKVM